MKTSLLILCVAVAAAAGGFVAYRHWSATGPQHVVALPASTELATVKAAVALPASAPSAATPAPDAAAAEAARKHPIPDMVPAVSMADMSGKIHSLLDYRGRPTIYNFWATWCGPCRREIPLLNTLNHEFAAQKLQIVGVAVDFKDDVAKYLNATQVDYPVLVGEEAGIEAADKLGMEMALPFSVFADSKSRIVVAKLGELHRDDADAILNALLAVDQGKIELPVAKLQISAKLRQLAQARAAR
jgi:thiol-disulfide isomerase/thioredoxin